MFALKCFFPFFINLRDGSHFLSNIFKKSKTQKKKPNSYKRNYIEQYTINVEIFIKYKKSNAKKAIQINRFAKFTVREKTPDVRLFVEGYFP